MPFFKHQTAELRPAVIYMLCLILLIRTIAMFTMGPMPQDAYYFFYASYPSLSYFDHPPAIAWLIRLFTEVFGQNTLAIKLGDTVITALTTVAVYRLSLRFYPVYPSRKVIVIFLSTLLVSILSLISTPDTPLLFFWTLALIHIHDAVFKDKKVSWIFAGLLMGLAFDSKYTAVFLPAGMIMFLLFSTTHRKKLLTIWPWLAILLVMIASMPVVIWNFGNGFASFVFQGSKRMGSVAELKFTPRFIFGLFGHQLALLVPVLFFFIFRSLFLLLKNRKGLKFNLNDKKLFLLCFFLPIFLAFMVLSPFYWIKINWMMPAYITGVILAGGVMEYRWVRLQLILSLIIHTALIYEILFYPFPVKSDDTWVGWRQLYDKTSDLQKKYKADFVFAADSYKTSAALNLFSADFIYGQNIIGEQALHFSYIGSDLSLLKGKCALFLDSQPGFQNARPVLGKPSNIADYFYSVEQLKPILIYKNGKVVRKFLVYLCHQYRPDKKVDFSKINADLRHQQIQ